MVSSYAEPCIARSDACGFRHGEEGKRTYRVATTQRRDVEESKDLVALMELEGRDVTCWFRSLVIVPLEVFNSCICDVCCIRRQRKEKELWIYIPLMILQKIQAAEDIFKGSVRQFK